MKINELKDQFLNYLVEYRGRSNNTQEAYGFDLSKFINYLHSQNITEAEFVLPKIIEEYLLNLKTSPVTQARVRSSIKSFFSFLFRKDYIGYDPTSKLESIKLPEKSPEYLSQEQQSIFLKTIERTATPFYIERDLMLIKLILRTGLRRAEIVGLNIGDVDFTKNALRVKRKGNKEVYLTIHPTLVEDLKKYLKSIARENDQPLFISKKCQRLSANSVWHLVKVYSQRAGFNGDVTVHSLRHSFASTLLSQGCPLPHIQSLMGHKSSQTTSKYLHFQNKELIEVLNKVVF